MLVAPPGRKPHLLQALAKLDAGRHQVVSFGWVGSLPTKRLPVGQRVEPDDSRRNPEQVTGRRAVKFSSSEVLQVAETTGFKAEMVEKVLQLLSLLNAMNAQAGDGGSPIKASMTRPR